MLGKSSFPRTIAMETLVEVKNIINPIFSLILAHNCDREYVRSLRFSFGKFFDKFETEHKLRNELKKRKLYMDPVCFQISRPHRLVLKQSHGYLLPIKNNIRTLFEFDIKSLKKMLQLHKKLLSSENLPIISEVQCPIWKEKMKNFEGLEVIPIRVYQDDFEINNALGSKSGNQKISGIYISFPLAGKL